MLRGDYDLFTYRIRLHEMDEVVLLHEYLHHLQNITTVFGVERLNAFVQIAAHLAGIAKRGEAIPVPLLACREKFLELENLRDHFLNALGHWHAFTYLHQAHPLQAPPGFMGKKDNIWAIADIDWYEDGRPEQVFTLLYNSGKARRKIFYPLGGLAVTEGQASCLTQLLRPDDEANYAVWPYRFILQYLREKGIENPEWTLLAISECALNSIPGRGLFRYLSQIENKIFSPAIDSKSAVQLIRDISEANREKWKPAFEAEMNVLERLQENIQDQHEPFREAIEYSIGKLSEGLQIREQDPAYFIARLLQIEGNIEELFKTFPSPFLQITVDHASDKRSDILSNYSVSRQKTRDGKENITFISSDPQATHASQMFQQLWRLIEGFFANPQILFQKNLDLQREKQGNTLVLRPKEVAPGETNYEGILLRVLNFEALPLVIHSSAHINIPKLQKIRFWKCCSFCHALEKNAEILVENSSYFICNHCVDEAFDLILSAKFYTDQEKRSAPDCSFCNGLHQSGQIVLSTAMGISICDECILEALDTIIQKSNLHSGEEIFTQLNAKNGREQYKALTLLGKQQQREEHLSCIIDKMGSNSPYAILRQKALQLVVNWGENAIPVLKNFLSSNDWRLRANCILALGYLGKDREDIAEIIFSFRHDPHPQIRLRVVWALVEMQAESILAKLEKIFAEEQDDSIRKEAEKSMASVFFDNMKRKNLLS